MNGPERRLATVALIVRDYDEAIGWYIDRLGISLARMSISAAASAG